MELSFSGEIFQWRGPAPFYYVALPPEEAAELAEVASAVTYGWGCIPVRAQVGETRFETSLFPKDGGYLVPVKAAVRRAEGVDDGDVVAVSLTVAGPA